MRVSFLVLLDDQAAGFGRVAWRRVPWTTYASEVGTTRPAVGDIDGDGVGEVVIGLGPHPENGGFLL